MIGWHYYKRLTVSDANVDADLSEFPLLVAFDDDADIGAHARSDGYDLRFTLDDGQTELSYERESFVVADGLASGRFWVRVPSILATGGAVLRCYYGNTDAGDAGDPTAVWGSNVFLLVSHMKNGASAGEVGSVLGPTGTKKAAGEPAEDSGGVVGECQSFDGTDDYVDFGTSVQPAGFVLEACARTSKTSNNCLASWTATDRCALVWATTGRPILWREATNWRYWDSAAGTLLTDGQWHHVAFLVPGAAAADINDADLLVDGVAQAVYATNATGVPLAKTYLLAADYSISGGMPYQGLIDELRISDPQAFPGADWTEKLDNIRAWLKFSWANMCRPGWELAWGQEVSPVGRIWAGARPATQAKCSHAAKTSLLAGPL